MTKKHLLTYSLLGAASLALAFKAIAGPVAPTKPDSKRAANSPSYNKIDAYIEAQMKRLSIPGAVLAVVEGDQITRLRGFGQARPGGETPAAQTPFAIGSLTKSFTALAIMQLVEAGKVELDAPVQRYLPWFCVADAQASAQITVRHLLNQTSGFSMLDGMVTLGNLDDRPGAMERQGRALSTLSLARPVGAAWEYSNLNYDLAGLVVEAASGEPYAEYVQKHIFDPLGMSRSYTSPAPARQNGLAVGHRYWFGIPVAAPNLPMPRGSLASGQLLSTAEDMAHYLIAHINAGLYNGVQILSEAGMDELHRGAVEYSAMGKVLGRYAMGWFVDGTGGAETVSHGGNVPEFSAYMGFVPGQKKGLVLLINADHYGLPMILPEVGNGAVALLAGRQPDPVRLGFVPWLMRLLALVPLLQVAGAAATLWSILRWRREPAHRPGRERLWGQHLLLPLLPNLALAALPLFLRSPRMLGYLRLYNPDVYWLALLGGGFAGVWAILRTGLILRVLRKAG